MAQPNSKQPIVPLSQPTFFSNNCLPPLSPSPHSESSNSSLKDVSLEEMDVSSRRTPAYAPSNNVFRGNESLPPRKGHRRSSSDTVPLAFSAIIQSSPQLVPISGQRKSDGEVIDELLNSYMNLDTMDAWNSSTKASGKIDTESVSGGKRSAATDIAPSTRHFRSRSMDSAFGSLNLADEPSKLPGLEFGNGEFSAVELKKIMTDERLAEVAISDPKRAKRILANRQSAARSKERKLRYISELEHKVQTLQTETTTLSAQHTTLQKDFTELTNQNNELKFRLQAMKQQAHLRDALHEALSAEVQRLKLASSEVGEEGGRSSNYFTQQSPVKHHVYPMHHEQPTQRNQLSVATSTTPTGSTAPTSA